MPFQALPPFSTPPRWCAVIAFLCAALMLSACSGNPTAQRQQYDFGLLPVHTVSAPAAASTSAATSVQISLAEINAPAALDSTAMLYRLQYDNGQQLKPYALHRWSMTPAALLSQRLKAQMATSGIQVAQQGEAAQSWPLLRIDLDEFSQVFSSASHSNAHIDLRASISKNNILIAQRRFQQQVSARSADAPGGAAAMQQATDQLIQELNIWIRSLPLK
ncbi:ABC-type transport auxiliary lipoprotein family protein [Undibacterium sp. SXout7W]|uniref:ABC-type transport auxiliary lipoprotein family protein n=1 Tax=Undibacterium sp. SXout7W TaxID=3413049 RepID=UPI003BF37F1A